MPLEPGFKYWRDNDTDNLNQDPPVTDTWYTVFDSTVPTRLIWCIFLQDNTDNANKNIEIRWSIDGNVYLGQMDSVDNTLYWVYRTLWGSEGGTTGLTCATVAENGAFYVDKRGAAFKVEIRMTSAVGTAQHLHCWCVRESFA